MFTLNIPFRCLGILWIVAECVGLSWNVGDGGGMFENVVKLFEMFGNVVKCVGMIRICWNYEYCIIWRIVVERGGMCWIVSVVVECLGMWWNDLQYVEMSECCGTWRIMLESGMRWNGGICWNVVECCR